jgi:exodeoxyribonuclease VII small subunit
MSAVNKTIQEKRAELSELVAWFDSDAFVLEDALVKFKQAETLAKEIEADLASVQNKITVLKEKFDAELS